MFVQLSFIPIYRQLVCMHSLPRSEVFSGTHTTEHNNDSLRTELYTEHLSSKGNSQIQIIDDIKIYFYLFDYNKLFKFILYIFYNLSATNETKVFVKIVFEQISYTPIYHQLVFTHSLTRSEVFRVTHTTDNNCDS